MVISGGYTRSRRRNKSPLFEIIVGPWNVRQTSCSCASRALMKNNGVGCPTFRACCINTPVSCSVIRAHRTCVARTLSPSHSGCSTRIRRHSSKCGFQGRGVSLLNICVGLRRCCVSTNYFPYPSVIHLALKVSLVEPRGKGNTYILHHTNKANTVLLSSMRNSSLGCGLDLGAQSLFAYVKDDSAFMPVKPRSCAIAVPICDHMDRNGFSLL